MHPCMYMPKKKKTENKNQVASTASQQPDIWKKANKTSVDIGRQCRISGLNLQNFDHTHAPLALKVWAEGRAWSARRRVVAKLAAFLDLQDEVLALGMALSLLSMLIVHNVFTEGRNLQSEFENRGRSSSRHI